MIVLPAFLAGIVPFLEAIFAGTIIGALFGAGAGAAGEVVSGVQIHGEINQTVVESAAQSALHGAAEGALLGGAFGGVGAIVAPAIPAIGAVVDDIARPIVNVVDDLTRASVEPVTTSIKSASKSLGMATNPLRNTINAARYRHLPKTSGNSGYVYVMDDAASGTHKIGRTNHPARRLPEVESATGKSLTYRCITPASNASQLEGALHKTFATSRLPNSGAGTEWFALSPAQVSQACSY